MSSNVHHHPDLLRTPQFQEFDIFLPSYPDIPQRALRLSSSHLTLSVNHMSEQCVSFPFYIVQEIVFAVNAQHQAAPLSIVGA